MANTASSPTRADAIEAMGALASVTAWKGKAKSATVQKKSGGLLR